MWGGGRFQHGPGGAGRAIRCRLFYQSGAGASAPATGFGNIIAVGAAPPRPARRRAAPRGPSWCVRLARRLQRFARGCMLRPVCEVTPRRTSNQSVPTARAANGRARGAMSAAPQSGARARVDRAIRPCCCAAEFGYRARQRAAPIRPVAGVKATPAARCAQDPGWPLVQLVTYLDLMET